MLKEFRDFAMKGNIVDLAAAVIIGGAFGQNCNSSLYRSSVHHCEPMALSLIISARGNLDGWFYDEIRLFGFTGYH